MFFPGEKHHSLLTGNNWWKTKLAFSKNTHYGYMALTWFYFLVKTKRVQQTLSDLVVNTCDLLQYLKGAQLFEGQAWRVGHRVPAQWHHNMTSSHTTRGSMSFNYFWRTYFSFYSLIKPSVLQVISSLYLHFTLLLWTVGTCKIIYQEHCISASVGVT